MKTHINPNGTKVSVPDNADIHPSVVISKNVTICAGASIAPGASIAEGAFIPARQTAMVVSGLRWRVTVYNNRNTPTMKIGCQCHPVEKWEKLSDVEISIMSNYALSFWKEYKLALITLAKTHCAGQAQKAAHWKEYKPALITLAKAHCAKQAQKAAQS